ncbi:MAG: STAS domain-containing protein [Casimicrobiaceae bacterium]|nr:STAS domain-containing protein [Casimicrobiaceae bacterium]
MRELERGGLTNPSDAFAPPPVELKFSGALDAATVPAHWAAHARAAAAADGWVIDLSGVDRIDSAGLAFLTALSRTLGGAQFVNVPAKARVLARAYDVEPLLGDA